MRRKRFIVRVDDGATIVPFKGKDLRNLLDEIEEKYENRRR